MYRAARELRPTLSRATAGLCVAQEEHVMITRILLVTVLALVVATPAGSATVEKREKNQAARINRGEKSGRLSHKEANRLRSQESAIKSEESAMRAAHGGHLTAADKHALQKDESRTSHHIYNQKHDENGH
jgi:hypothetical protein